MKHINKQGFSMIELMGALVIIAVLTVSGGLAVNTSVKRANVDGTTAQLQVFASDMEAVLEDVGIVEFKPGDTDAFKKSTINQYLAEIEDGYMHAYFDRNSVVVGANNFRVRTLDVRDSWDSPMTVIYNTNAAKGEPGLCMFISPGPNMVLEDAGYKNSNFSDDILVIVKPK